jgi:hypothetical protein
MDERYEIALFALSPDGARLLGRTRDRHLVRLVRACLAADHRQELARLEPPVRVTRGESLGDEGADE